MFFGIDRSVRGVDLQSQPVGVRPPALRLAVRPGVRRPHRPKFQVGILKRIIKLIFLNFRNQI